ncbi:MAG: hypothetical protein ACTSYJ_01765 [Candidatus Thorarchaeota archaeon]
MLRKDGSEQKVDEMEMFPPPGLVFVVLPAFLSLLGALTLTLFPGLIIAYNYLRGASSPIDQYALALLGSDLTRIMIFISWIIGMAIGLYLSRFVTAKLDVVRKERETEISKRMFFALLFWWNFLFMLNSMIWSLDSYYNGFATSRFLSDLGWFMTAGYFLAFSIPVLLKYVRLVLHARSIDSRVKLIEHRSENGFIKLKYLTLKVIYDGPDP